MSCRNSYSSYGGYLQNRDFYRQICIITNDIKKLKEGLRDNIFDLNLEDSIINGSLKINGDLDLSCNLLNNVSNITFCNGTNYNNTLSLLDTSINLLETTKYDKTGGLITGDVEISGNLDLCCNFIQDICGIFFCDGTFIGQGNSFDISTNQQLDVKTSQGLSIEGQSITASSGLDTEISINVKDTNSGGNPDNFIFSLNNQGDGVFYCKTFEIGDGEQAYSSALIVGGLNKISFNKDIDLQDNDIIDVSGIHFNDGTFIGQGNSFDISTNQILKINENMFVVNTNGNIGIGKQTPSKKLDISGDIICNVLETRNSLTLGGQLDLGNNKIINLSDASDNNEAVHFGQVYTRDYLDNSFNNVFTDISSISNDLSNNYYDKTQSNERYLQKGEIVEYPLDKASGLGPSGNSFSWTVDGKTYNTQSSSYFENGNLFPVWKLFDGIFDTIESGWASEANSYDNGKYNSDNSLGGFDGEWAFIKLPDQVEVNEVKIYSRPQGADDEKLPQKFYILGSNDETNWTELLYNTNELSWSPPEVKTFTLTTTGSYQYYAIVVNTVGAGGLITVIAELEFVNNVGIKETIYMNNNKIVNLADGTDTTDAVNLGQLTEKTIYKNFVDTSYNSIDSYGATFQDISQITIDPFDISDNNGVYSINVNWYSYSPSGDFGFYLNLIDPSNNDNSFNILKDTIYSQKTPSLVSDKEAYTQGTRNIIWKSNIFQLSEFNLILQGISYDSSGSIPVNNSFDIFVYKINP